MKKIIDGKVYDTEKATRIIQWSGGPSSDIFFEELYKTQNGNYFLYGEGAENTNWAIRIGDDWYNGWGIMPLNEKEAMEWIEFRNIPLTNPEEIFSSIKEA